MTMPVVPSTESPPSIPSRPFRVFLASAAPPGIETSISRSGRAECCSAISLTVSVIMRRGAGLMAGSPTASCRPGRVTVPTPSPALKVTPLSGAPGVTRASTRA